MKRYSKKEMDAMSGIAFAKDILCGELNTRDNPYSPVAQKLRETISEMEFMEETKLSYPMLKLIFRAWESQNPRPAAHLNAYIVFKPESSKKGEDYTISSRAYAVSSDNEAFQPAANGDSSIYGTCMNGVPTKIRLDERMALEKGHPKKGWQVDFCILQQNFLNANRGTV